MEYFNNNNYWARFCIVTILLIVFNDRAQGEGISFEEATQQANIFHSSQSFGVSWGDANGDGFPDIYSSNHWTAPNLYINDGNGKFSDAAKLHEVLLGHDDVHGAAWGDFDNDGDQDLVTAVGGSLPGGISPDTPFFINTDGILRLHDPIETGLTHGHHDRTPTWYDENSDGDLDLIMASKIKEPENYSALLRQTDNIFENKTDELGLANLSADWSAPIIVGDDFDSQYLLFNNGLLYQKFGEIWQEATAEVFPKRGIVKGIDYAFGDVNGDGLFDLYVIREGNRSQVKAFDKKIEVSYITDPDQIGTLEFRHSGDISIDYGLSLAPRRFLLGASQTSFSGRGTVLLSSGDPVLKGEPTIELPNDSVARVYIWYTSSDEKWHIKVGNTILRRNIELRIQSSSSFANVLTENIQTEDFGATNYLFLGNSAGKFDLADSSSQIQFKGKSRSGVFGDFDNDMDLDLYLVNRNLFDNPPNQLFENIGNGRFVEIADAGGAAGARVGSGDSVSVADYDLDGYLDLFVVNGATGMRVDSFDGPQQIYSNTSQGNHWIEIDLVGTDSNRDAIGAVVELETDGVKQVRFQDGGIHRYGQHFNRLHFGLGGNRYIDRLAINWPSGKIDQYHNIPADHVLEIHEEQGEFLPGQPNSFEKDQGVYIYKKFYDGPYYFWFRNIEGEMDNSIEILTDGDIKIAKLDNNPAPISSNRHFQSSIKNGLVEVDLQNETQSLVKIQENGRTRFHNINIGMGFNHPKPSAWILDVSALGKLPNFESGLDLGLFIGKHETRDDIIKARVNGNGKLHSFDVSVLSEAGWNRVVPVLLEESDDVLTVSDNHVRLRSLTAVGWDGFNIANDNNRRIGISYVQDQLTPTKYINHRDNQFKFHNAFILPRPVVYGKPKYDPGVTPGIFVWKDEQSNVWHFRFTGGGTRRPWAQYKGTITLSADPTLVETVSIERNDVVTRLGDGSIDFHLNVMGSGEDGIDLTLPDNAQINLNLSSENAAFIQQVYIGSDRWPVEAFPVTITE